MVMQNCHLSHWWKKQKHMIGEVFFVHFQELEDVFSHWPRLLQMDLSGNPACKKTKYRDRLITVCKRLGEVLLTFSLIDDLFCALYCFDIKAPLYDKM